MTDGEKLLSVVFFKTASGKEPVREWYDHSFAGSGYRKASKTPTGDNIMARKKHIGSSFDGFLEDEGLLAQTTVEAVKRVLAWQVAEAMKSESISKAEMARRMQTSRAALDRLLDPENSSVTLRTMHKAATVLGKQIRMELVG